MAVEDSLLALEKRFAAGDKSALADALHLVVVNRLTPPTWVWQAFTAGWGGVVSGRLASWDDVLGKRHKNSRKRAAARWQWELRYPVWHKVRRLNAGDGIGISDELFQIVAEQFGLTKRNVSELYHRMQRSGGRHANIFPPHRRKRRR
jgi:hypothetical protein